jgi:hypothetical protein
VATKDRKAATKDRKAATKDRKVATKDRKAATKDRKAAMERVSPINKAAALLRGIIREGNLALIKARDPRAQLEQFPDLKEGGHVLKAELVSPVHDLPGIKAIDPLQVVGLDSQVLDVQAVMPVDLLLLALRLSTVERRRRENRL